MTKTKHHKKPARIMSLIALLILPLLAIDQLSKLAVRLYFEDVLYYKTLKVTPFLNFTEVLNDGVAFGFFGGLIHSNLVFIAITSLVLIYFFYLLLTLAPKEQTTCYGLIIAGAFGNLMDRVFYGAVYDFIDLHVGSLHWYTFNIADMYVCFGAILFFFTTFFKVR